MPFSAFRNLAFVLLLVAACGDDDGVPDQDGPSGGDAAMGPDAPRTPDAGGTPDAAGAAAWIGEECALDDDCAGGLCFPESFGFPGGYCTHEACDLGVPDSCLAYGGDGYCLDAGGGTGYCFDRCDDMGDCRTGYGCVPVGMGRSVCYPIPVCGNGIVEAGEECEPPSSGNCGADCIGTGTAPIGDPCAGPEDCAGDFCATDGFPMGYCVQLDCDLSMPDTSCGAFGGDGVCIDIGDATPFGICFDACDPGAAVSECRTGYLCVPGGPALGICFPAPVCGDGTVEFPEECEPPGAGNCGADCIGTGTAPIGDACMSAADCAGNACIDEMGAWPMGYCAQAGCDLSIDRTAACAAYGGDGICLDVSDPAEPPFGVCLDECVDGADCRVGYVCQFAGPGTHVCAPAPTCGDGSIDFPEECEPPGAGSCGADCIGTGTAPVGATCADATDCAGDACFAMADGFTGGYCTDFDCDLTAADPVAACAGAGGDGVCLDLFDQGIGFCFDQCSGGGSCRPGYSCTMVPGGYRVCTP